MAPQAHMVVNTHDYEISGWKIIFRLIHSRDPNIGGMNSDVQYELSNLAFNNGEQLGDKFYRNLLQDRLPGDKKVPGQRKSELFTRFHRPGLRPEGKTQIIRGKERRGNDLISGCDQQVPIDKNCDNKTSSETLLKKIHQRDQEDHQTLLRTHPLWYELHPYLLRW